MATIPGHGWRDFKKELMEKWHELTENDIERTGGERRSLMDLLERKVGMKIEDASEHIEQMAERYHLYDEPEESKADIVRKENEERVLEINPKAPKERNFKPKNL
ncbi:MAG TPA: transcriptional regulator [Bdellovibrio sp.]|uniref:transcriptional regulator n=1 Tax=Bdellovibrio sp. TaxID=28201 RepID=UPI002F21B79F